VNSVRAVCRRGQPASLLRHPQDSKELIGLRQLVQIQNSDEFRQWTRLENTKVWRMVNSWENSKKPKYEYLPLPSHVSVRGTLTKVPTRAKLPTSHVQRGKERGEMSPSGNRAVATVLTLISAPWVFRQAQAHPNCIGDFSPPDVKANFCSYTDDLWGDGFCCNAAEENAIKADVDASGATGDCKTMYQEVRETTRPRRPCG